MIAQKYHFMTEHQLTLHITKTIDKVTEKDAFSSAELAMAIVKALKPEIKSQK